MKEPLLTPLATDPNTEVVVAPPSLYLLLAREHLDPKIRVAAQNVFDKPSGAFTGEISPQQLKDSGITWVVLGHSERRTILREDDDFVAAKTKAALDTGINVILCCGESLEEREKGVTVDVVTRQLQAVNKAIGKDGWKNVVIAYEPIWAIGTGKVATTGMLLVRRSGCVLNKSITNGRSCCRASTRSSCRNQKMACRLCFTRGGREHQNHLWWQCNREELHRTG